MWISWKEIPPTKRITISFHILFSFFNVFVCVYKFRFAILWFPFFGQIIIITFDLRHALKSHQSKYKQIKCFLLFSLFFFVNTRFSTFWFYKYAYCIFLVVIFLFYIYSFNVCVCFILCVYLKYFALFLKKIM